MDLPWWTIDGGGIQTEAGSYTLLATVGQPDAAQVSANWYELRSGYWPGATIRHPRNYLLPTGLAIEHYVSDPSTGSPTPAPTFPAKTPPG